MTFQKHTLAAAAAMFLGLTAGASACPSAVPVTADHMVNFKDFGGVPNQFGVDMTPFFNCALNYVKANQLRAIYIGYGWYWFQTQPQSIDFPVTIYGDGKGRTYLIRYYTATSASQGPLTFLAGANSASVRDLAVVAGQGSVHGAAISLVANATNSPSFMFFSDLYLSADPTGNWDYTVYINGVLKNQDPIGVRDLDFHNCSVFGAANGAMLLDGVVGFNFIGGGTFPAGGVLGTQGLVVVSPSVDGSLNANGQPNGLPSYYLNFNTGPMGGLVLNAALHSHFSAYFQEPVTASSFSVDNIIIGHAGMGAALSWKQSKYIDPEN